MTGAFFVVASSADHKLINRVLLKIRDWEYGEDPTWDNFLLITSKILPETEASATKPPITENDLSNNIWTGQSISDVESFMLNEQKKEAAGLNLNTFIILDEQGVKDGTMILLDLYVGDDGPAVERFNKVRVPWAKTYIMWCNLDIANMNFEDFVEDEDGDEVEWWTYMNDDEDQGTDEAKSIKEKMQNAIAELEQKGMA